MGMTAQMFGWRGPKRFSRVRVSNPRWPFVDMSSGTQGAAAFERLPTMSAVTASPGTTAKTPSRLTRTLPRATASAGVLAAAATTAGAAVLRAAGVPLAAHGMIPLAAFAQFTFIADPQREAPRCSPTPGRQHGT